MYEAVLKDMMEAALQADVWIKKVYAMDFPVEIKEDNSPVTEADKGADEIIRAYLSARYPEAGFLTEESSDDGSRFSKRAIFIVDPVDGTKEFVSRNGQFTTNIAYCVDHEIVVGVIRVPLFNVTYYAIKGQGAFRQEDGKEPVRIHVSDRTTHLRACRSISHVMDGEREFYERHKDLIDGEPVPIGAARKFCMIAEGSYDIFVRYSGGTKEWDIAPGDLIVTEAGGVMCEPDGKRFTYNRQDVYNRKGYMLANCEEVAALK